VRILISSAEPHQGSRTHTRVKLVAWWCLWLLLKCLIFLPLQVVCKVLVLTIGKWQNYKKIREERVTSHGQGA